MSSIDLIQKLASETGEITWPELQRHFARGVLVRVSAPLDLLEAAAALADNEVSRVDEWMGQGLLGKATDTQASDWSEHSRRFRAVVVAPWVLVQELDEATSPE